MSARAAVALLRATWYQALSYRLSFVMQFFGLLMTVVPLYFIAGALQETMAATIASESEQFFAFVLVGSIALMFVTASMTTLQAAIRAGISTGYFESLLMTRTPLGWIFGGLTSYGLLISLIRAVIMIVTGWLLGAHVAWGQVLPALLIIVLLCAVHWGIGLIAAGLVIAFRTAGPLTQAVTTISVFFGGVYYPASALPSWLRTVPEATPLAYGLRALRRVLLQGDGLAAVAADVGMLVAMSVLTLMAGAATVAAGLRYARRTGALSTY